MIERYVLQRDVIDDSGESHSHLEMEFTADYLTDIMQEFHSFLIASGFSYVTAVASQKSDGDIACSDGWEYTPDYDEDEDEDDESGE
jgi:hypothetical protein